jgi:thioesterase domain-containing protein
VILQAANFGREYLQDLIGREFLLARHIGVVVESADDAAVVLRAPLAPNANHQGTAFGGSLYSLSVLTGWAWLTRYLAARDLAADGVIQESNMRFLIPVEGELRACAESPSAAQLARFLKMLQRAGRGRISLHVHITYRETLATLFEGVFVAAMRR